jgi:hypothetical protein
MTAEAVRAGPDGLAMVPFEDDGDGGEQGDEQEDVSPRGRGQKIRLGRLFGPGADRFLAWLVEGQDVTAESDTQYAKRLGLSRPQYANAKAGRTGLSRPMIERICRRHADCRAAYIALCLTPYAGEYGGEDPLGIRFLQGGRPSGIGRDPPDG